MRKDDKQRYLFKHIRKAFKRSLKPYDKEKARIRRINSYYNHREEELKRDALYAKRNKHIHNIKMYLYYQRHKDEINRKRRERYRLKKEQEK